MITVNCVTDKGGSVELNKKHGVWTSYAVTKVGNLPEPELLYTRAKLPDGRSVQFFLNRETGLIVVDIQDKNGKGGNEILRATVSQPQPAAH